MKENKKTVDTDETYNDDYSAEERVKAFMKVNKVQEENTKENLLDLKKKKSNCS